MVDAFLLLYSISSINNKKKKKKIATMQQNIAESGVKLH